jgi:hypothetical protein
MMRWKCDYGHLDELKNIPFPIFPSLRFAYDLFRLEVIFSGASLTCSVRAFPAVLSTLESSAISPKSTSTYKHTSSPSLREVFLVETTILQSHLALVGLSTLLTRARLIVGKLVDEQPLPRTAESDGAFLDTQLFFKSLVEAVSTGGVAADSSGAHDVDVVGRVEMIVE